MTNWKKYFEEIKEYWIVDENDSTKNTQLEKIREYINHLIMKKNY